ncbi:MAG: MarC family protein [Rhodomicrobium sp.]
MLSLSVSASSFFAAFAVIFTISNPIGCALIYSQITVDLSREERIGLARRIAINSALVLAVATWAGSMVLSFLGVGIAALRIAGGLVVAGASLAHAPRRRKWGRRA